MSNNQLLLVIYAAYVNMRQTEPLSNEHILNKSASKPAVTTEMVDGLLLIGNTSSILCLNPQRNHVLVNRLQMEMGFCYMTWDCKTLAPHQRRLKIINEKKCWWIARGCWNSLWMRCGGCRWAENPACVKEAHGLNSMLIYWVGRCEISLEFTSSI